MQISTLASAFSKTATDILAIFISQDQWEKELIQLEQILKTSLTTYLKEDQFKAGLGKTYVFPTAGRIPAKTLVLVGVGKVKDLTPAKVRLAAAALGKLLKNSQRANLAIDLNQGVFISNQNYSNSKAIVEGLILGGYSFTKYKSEQKKLGIKLVWLLVKAGYVKQVSQGITNGKLFAMATNFARDLVNEPPTFTSPSFLAEQALKLADGKNLTVEVFGADQIKKMGMEAFLSVARGSDEPPKFIKLTYRGGGKKIILAGKAITFDTGGLSLKPAKGMETMKLDMAGAASVLGVFRALTQLKPKATVIGLIGACDNMPGPKATKPGDIVRALNGKTIEVLNTDAEGRMTLADMLSYGVKEKPAFMIDLATLTGACLVALGEEIAGLFTNNQNLADELLDAAKEEGEKMWQLPLEEDYREEMKSDLADLRNISKTRYGGSITAALFLSEFVDQVPWVHLDIAGPAFAEKDTSLSPKGGTGFGVRTLLSWFKGM